MLSSEAVVLPVAALNELCIFWCAVVAPTIPVVPSLVQLLLLLLVPACVSVPCTAQGKGVVPLQQQRSCCVTVLVHVTCATHSSSAGAQQLGW
jgi:hypothetical protein